VDAFGAGDTADVVTGLSPVGSEATGEAAGANVGSVFDGAGVTTVGA
jgi:hypothetical protein